MAIGSWPYANGDGRDAMRIYPSSTRVRHVLPHTSIGPAPVNVFEMERKVTNNHSGIIYNFREGCWWCWTLLSSSVLIHCILGRCGWLSARNSVRTLAGHKGMNVGVVGREDNTWRAQMRKNLILIGRRLSVLPLVFGSRGCQQYFTAHTHPHISDISSPLIYVPTPSNHCHMSCYRVLSIALSLSPFICGYYYCAWSERTTLACCPDCLRRKDPNFGNEETISYLVASPCRMICEVIFLFCYGIVADNGGCYLSATDSSFFFV